MPKTKRIRLIAFIALISSLCAASSGVYAEKFVVNKIRVEGLKNISEQTVLSYLPVKVGQSIDSNQTSNIIRALYKTGFFNNISINRTDNTLVIRVTEKQIISAFNYSSVKAITKKQMQDVLSEMQIGVGRELDWSSLTQLQQALIQQYYNLGHYAAKVQIDVQPQKDNRVIVTVNAYEGPITAVREIKIVGNKAFPERTLLKVFDSKTTKWWRVWNTFTHTDQYSKEKLDADLDHLTAFYMNRGYLAFKIDNAQVSMSPDRKDIYVTVHVTEGPLFHISGYKFTGNLLDKEADIRKAINMPPGTVFSRQGIIDISDFVSHVLASFGYANANVQPVPSIDEKNHTVFINFVVTPGKRVYVRRMSFTGNSKTQENVLRREIRQPEGALYSYSAINVSKQRLRNTGYVEDVDVKMEPVPGEPDQTDLVWNVKEAQSMFANFRVGYSDTDKFIYGASINENNFMGTGKGVGLQFDNSTYNQTYSASYFNPYHTLSGISLKLSAYMQHVKPSAVDMSSYSTNAFGASAIYGIPMSDFSSLHLGYGYEHINVTTNNNTPLQILAFIKQHGNKYDEAKLFGGYGYNTLDRPIFPTQGMAHSIDLELGVPAARKNLNYYTVDYNGSYYKPIFDSNFIFHARAELGYGNGFGNTKLGNTHILPFYKNYTAGGMTSVRGFTQYSLGPKDAYGNTLGGNVLTTASASIIFPNPLGDVLRTSIFIDAGNVYDNQFKFKDLRSGAGLQVDWRSPLGIISVDIAEPIHYFKPDPNSKDPNRRFGDSKKYFDFSIGTSF